MSFTVDLDELEAEAKRLADLKGTTLQDELLPEFNRIVDETYQLSREHMLAEVNLTDAYIQSRMEVSPATASKGLLAEITTRGGREDQTPLGRYFSRQFTLPAPGAAGDPSRGIPPGRKQGGVTVEVKRGRAVPVAGQKAFTMPLRAGKVSGGNGLGVFVRTKYGLLRHLYGPAPYQLFRGVIEDIDESVGDTLEERLGALAERVLRNAL